MPGLLILWCLRRTVEFVQQMSCVSVVCFCRVFLSCVSISSNPVQDNIFNSGGHVEYPRCEVEPLQIVQAGLHVHEHVDGLQQSDIRRPLAWRDLESIMETIQKPAVLVVRGDAATACTSVSGRGVCGSVSLCAFRKSQTL